LANFLAREIIVKCINIRNNVDKIVTSADAGAGSADAGVYNYLYCFNYRSQLEFTPAEAGAGMTTGVKNCAIIYAFNYNLSKF